MVGCQRCCAVLYGALCCGVCAHEGVGCGVCVRVVRWLCVCDVCCGVW